MSDFEYLSVLIAIIVGIGFADLLLSIGRIVWVGPIQVTGKI